MGQKVHPVGFRLGVYRGWKSRWFARAEDYGDLILEDIKIRKFVETALENAEVADVEIERAGNNLRILINSARPGAIIGRKGQEVDTLRTELARILGKKYNIEISVKEVRQPELNASLIAHSIAAQLVKRVSYKKAMRSAANTALRAGAKGIKIRCAGRLNGAEIARCEGVHLGSIPLHTLRADIDYCEARAVTTYGVIGVKVWICKGEYSLQRV